MSEKIERALRAVKDKLGDESCEPIPAHDGMKTVFAQPAKLVEVLQALKENDEGAFDMLTDLTAVDYLNKPERGYRFELVYHLCSTANNHRMRIKVCLKEDNPSAPTITGVYSAAGWLEREVFDMFGITFEGHPDLRRILLWDGYEGHPLRKDFPTRGLHPPERTPYL